MKTKRYLALVLTVIMCFTLFPSYAAAADNVTFTAIEGTAQGAEHEGYDKLVDGNTKTKWCVQSFESAYIIVKASKPIMLSGYTFTTGGDNSGYKGRNPKNWTVYGCNNYSKENGDTQWKELATVTNDGVLQDENLQSYSFKIENNKKIYQYYMLKITATKGNTVMQLSEMAFLQKTEEEISAEEKIGFDVLDGTEKEDGTEPCKNLVDGNTETKWCVDFSKDKGAYVVIKAEEPIAVTGYTFTTANDNSGYKGRNPKSWTLEGCNDYDETNKTGGEWVTLHTVENDTTMKNENYKPFSFSIPENAAKTKYTYFRFNITKNQGNECLQLSEIGFSYTACVHVFEENVEIIPATCTESGKIIKHCANCGYDVMVEGDPASGHNYVVKEHTTATCTESEKIIKKCTKCGYEITEIGKAALGHDLGADGTCTRCGASFAAKVGEKGYFDLVSAVDAANGIAEVRLVHDVSIDKTLSVADKDCILDLSGYTLKMTGKGSVVSVSNGKTFTLKDSSKGKTGKITGGNAVNGGGVCVANGSAFEMKGGTIFECTATGKGGGVYADGDRFNMTGGSISECTAKQGGGVCVWYGKTFNMNGGTIVGCKSSQGGGGVFVAGGTFNMNGGTVSGCSSEGNYGGGIYVLGGSASSTYTAVVTINNGIVENCKAHYGGGIYASDRATITIENNSHIRGNEAGWYGGGIAVSAGPNVTVKDSCIEKNTASEAGGINAANSSITLENAKIEYNSVKGDGGSVKGDGGGIKLSSSTLSMDFDSSISNNTAKGDGGGIYAVNRSTVTLENGSINYNNAAWGGGVYLHYGSKMTMSEGTYVSYNTAENNGGGIIVNDVYNNNSDYPSTITMNGGSIEGNTANYENKANDADGNGGGICGQKKAVINIEKGDIRNNTAKNGGGIFSNDGSTVTITNGNIGDNTAAKDGGGIYLNSNSGEFNLKGGNVTGNTAAGNGGGIYDNAAVFNIQNDPHVTGNIKGIAETTEGGHEEKSNIYLVSGRKISGSLSQKVAPPMISVTLEDKNQAITNEFADDCSGYISSDDESYVVIYDSETKTHSLWNKNDSVRITIDVYTDYPGVYPDLPEYSAPDSYVIKKGTEFTEPAAPSAENYRFLGWYKDGMRYDFTQPVTEDITLTAKWAANGKPAIELTADSYIVSGLSEQEQAVVYLASYNSKGGLVEVKTVKATNRKMPINEVIYDMTGIAQIKAFLWGDGMLPLCEGAFRTFKQ